MEQPLPRRLSKPQQYIIEIPKKTLTHQFNTTDTHTNTHTNMHVYTHTDSPVKKTDGEPSPSNKPLVLESKRSQSPTANTAEPANCHTHTHTHTHTFCVTLG